MVTAVILSGGTGNRMGTTIPKQYIEIEGKPIIGYTLEAFEKHGMIDHIIVTAVENWHSFILEWIDTLEIKKFLGFADAGSSRQQSVFNGLRQMKEYGAGMNDIVIIHDAVRPRITSKLISGCVKIPEDADGVMPVLPVKDTVYRSQDGIHIHGLLNRDELFAGQAPESFRFEQYYTAHQNMDEQNLSNIRGSNEIAYMNGMKIHMIPGTEENYKLTTPEDLERFRQQIRNSVIR